MPAYNTHRIFNYVVFIIIAGFLYNIVFSFFELKQFIILCAGYYVGTDFITPDLDINSTVIKRWGWLKGLWLPYMWLFRHGKSSHNIVFGGVVRLIYIAFIAFFLYYLIFQALPPEAMIQTGYVLIFLAGILLANALHVILDMLF